ncbi:uncharacterized protein Pargl1 [Rattus norvegicus]|uniref:uncharacterized protein Pargl1 n=1 Tax=Rattus norvegicus TaxID=10116 RepID=UPI0003D0A4BB
MLAGLLLYPTDQSGAGPGHARPARVTSPLSLHKHTYCSAHRGPPWALAGAFSCPSPGPSRGSTTHFLSESKESTYATKRKLPTERAGFPKGISEKDFRNKQLGAQTGNLDSWEEIGSGVKGKHSHRRTQARLVFASPSSSCQRAMSAPSSFCSASHKQEKAFLGQRHHSSILPANRTSGLPQWFLTSLTLPSLHAVPNVVVTSNHKIISVAISQL